MVVRDVNPRACAIVSELIRSGSRTSLAFHAEDVFELQNPGGTAPHGASRPSLALMMSI